MSLEQMEARLAAVERELADMKRQLSGVGQPVVPNPHSTKWWERIKPIPEHLLPAFDEAMAYGRYWRKTGKEAPPDWRPGDPIPEPEYDE